MLQRLEGTIRYLAVVACLCFATTAQAAQNAQNADSIYAGVSGGMNLLHDVTLSQSGFTSVDMEMDAGFNFGGVIGYKWAMGLRAEAEVSYRQNDIDNILGISVNGDMSALAFMANAWYDIHTQTAWIPYVGGGVGVARVSLEFSDVNFDETDTVFAWQLGGGVGFEVSPGIVISVDYRFLATTDPSYPDPGFPDLKADYYSHSFLVGVRGHF